MKKEKLAKGTCPSGQDIGNKLLSGENLTLLEDGPFSAAIPAFTKLQIWGCKSWRNLNLKFRTAAINPRTTECERSGRHRKMHENLFFICFGKTSSSLSRYFTKFFVFHGFELSSVKLASSLGKRKFNSLGFP